MEEKISPETGENVTEPTAEDAVAEVQKWKALARQNEARAKANAEKAKNFDALEEAQKTELQKALDKADAAERRAGQAEDEAKRSELAAKAGVSTILVPKNLSDLEAEEWLQEAQKLQIQKNVATPQEMGMGFQSPKNVTFDDILRDAARKGR